MSDISLTLWYNKSMDKRICFIGHRNIPRNFKQERLENVILEKIYMGYRNFILGSHGEFDNLVLSVLRKIRTEYKDINIDLVSTSIARMNKPTELSTLPTDVNNVVYEIEETHYKRKITESNQRMIDESDLLIAYVDETKYQSGAKTAYKYALKQNKEVINLFRPEDEPTFGMTSEEKEQYWKNLLKDLEDKLKGTNH